MPYAGATGSPALSDPPVPVGAAADPVAAFFDAHERGLSVSLPTSGTTSRPRAVVRTTASWVSSFPHVARLTALGAGDRVWVPGPASGTMNLFATVLARWTGASLVDEPSRATHAHLTPSLLLTALDEGVALGGVHVTVAGDRLAASLAARAVAAGAQVAHYYGAAELSFVAWGTCADDLAAFPGAEVEVRDGEVWVRSPYLAEGYAADAGPYRRTGDGFATVGDRGRLEGSHGDRLVVTGRGDAAVLTGGTTVLVADVEAALRRGLRGDLVVVGTPHARLGEVVTAVLTDPTDHPTAWRAARGELAPAQRPRRWYRLDALPVTAAGKTDRAGVRRVLVAGGATPLIGSGKLAADSIEGARA